MEMVTQNYLYDEISQKHTWTHIHIHTKRAHVKTGEIYIQSIFQLMSY